MKTEQPTPQNPNERPISLGLPQPQEGKQSLTLAERHETISFRTDKSYSPMPGLFGQSSHPFTALFHVCYKIFLIFLFLTLPLTIPTLNFIAIIILAIAVDFWFVKNIAGRKLVGLRWWVEFSEQGEENWKFEHRVDQRGISSANETIFWWPFYLFIIAWFVLGVINAFGMKIHQILICVFSIVLLNQNLSCYSKCYKTKSQNMSRFVDQCGQDVMLKYMRGSIVTNMQ